MNITIVGLGLLGGSFGLALKKLGSEFQITGVDIDSMHAKEALNRGIVDHIDVFEQAIGKSDLIVLATPVNTIEDQILECLNIIQPHAVVIDMGSTKSAICTKAQNHGLRGRFIASHPIAGTEDSGPKAAFAELFDEKMIIICESEKSDPDALDATEKLYQSLGMAVEYMSPTAHDIHIAYVSHLSHISSFALGSTVLEKEKNEKNIFIMAGSGFESTVRLAKSSPDMWSPIFSKNRANISEALGMYIEKLKTFKEFLDLDDQKKTHEFMKETNDIRRILKDPGEK